MVTMVTMVVAFLPSVRTLDWNLVAYSLGIIDLVEAYPTLGTKVVEMD